MPRIKPLPLLFAFPFVAAPAAATVYVLPTDASMVERSPVIVFGEVRSAGPALGAARPSTDYAVEVEEVLKGFVPGGTILVRQPGGVGPGGVAMRVLGLPMLAESDRVLLFLEPVEGVYRPVELGLGLFFEVRTGGRDLLVGEPNREPRDADRFRRWIADRVAGRDRPADYFEADWPAGPMSVAEPFRLTRSPSDCFHDGVAQRWREFDRGQSVGVTVQSSGQPGVPDGGLSEVRTAIRVWNDDPASRANLVLRATSDGEFPLDEVDGRNSITYEDPFDEIPGSYRLGQGGTLATTYTFFYCHEGITPHRVPENEEVEALEIIEANVTTQDGYQEWVSSRSNPRKAHEEIMGHELGHVLGISHPCGDSASGACDSVTVQALMRAYVHGDGRGAALVSDDRAAVRHLYPLPGSSEPDPEPDPTPDPEPDPSPDPEPDPDPDSSCSAGTCLLQDDRFRVRTRYARDGMASRAAGTIPTDLGGGAGLFSFGSGSPELLVRIVDDCRRTGYWTFYAGPASDARYAVAVRDTTTNELKWFRAQAGESIRDGAAFSCD